MRLDGMGMGMGMRMRFDGKGFDGGKGMYVPIGKMGVRFDGMGTRFDGDLVKKDRM